MKVREEKIGVLCRLLEKQQVTETHRIEEVQYQPCGYQQDGEIPAEGYRPFTDCAELSGKDRHFWFQLYLRTPKLPKDKKIFLIVETGREGRWDATNPQGLVYLNGAVVQGIDVNHTEVLLRQDTEYVIHIYFYTGMEPGKLEFRPAFQIIDCRIEKLFYDVWVPFSALQNLDENSLAYTRTFKVLDQAANLVCLRSPYSSEYYDSLETAEKFLQQKFYQETCGGSQAVVDCIGHTHIDVAWLWTLAQTREKAQRSFATVLALMEEYPEYKFMSSQPQLYQYVKEAAPAVYEKIKQRVREGRWEVEGAMWLEADCNLPSGESLVRQILYGKQFIKEEFGVDSKILWLPDVFGYSAALPQILRKSGIEYFVTSKISWNDTNKLPYDSFLWKGIDGSEIFTNFLTAQDYPPDGVPVNYSCYNGDITPSMVKGAYNRYQQKEYSDRVMDTFGYGDGGGGPTRKMLEQQRRLSKGLPGYPKTEIHTALEHLEMVKKSFYQNGEALRRIPRWTGELYLEYHRGTYTSMAQNKRYNRKMEFLLQKAEGLAAAASLLSDTAYPSQQLRSLWLTTLKNQFHDIIPGSSIFEVYEDSRREYAVILNSCEDLAEEYLERLAERVDATDGYLVYNSLGFARTGTVSIEGKTLETGRIPAFGWKVLRLEKAEDGVKVAGNTIENKWYRIEINAYGGIASLVDKRFQREVFQEGKIGNELLLFEDFPQDYDAWDIPAYYQEKPLQWQEKAELSPVYDGDRAGLRISRNYQSSTIIQTVYLYRTLPRIDFDTEIQWSEEHQLLKAAFPLKIHNSHATYEIQFGNLERPTYRNTSWDAARFEVCGHKWADLSEGNYGVSILNDCKYGWSAVDSTLCLTLLKCATYPNPQADKGSHAFTYSLLPHGGDYRQGETVREAYSLNQPLMWRRIKTGEKKLPSEFSLVSCSNPNIIIETFKQSEDGKGYIIRLYDAHNCNTNAVLSFGVDLKRVFLCDLLENPGSELHLEGRKVKVPVSNFEIVTLKVEK